ncbi:hypothetical protein [Mesorhizobium sp. M1143]|uniref:hypothetical protein n=1 Tax=Mesorhizobium sp. M1143 TaxID=2957061 RepID=UPI003339F746
MLHAKLIEAPLYAFDGRLIRLAQRVANDGLTHGGLGEVEFPLWSAVVTSVSEVAISHNFAFRPTGMMREAFVNYLNAFYARNASVAGYQEDVSKLKVNEISNCCGRGRSWRCAASKLAKSPKRRMTMTNLSRHRASLDQRFGRVASEVLNRSALSQASHHFK